MSNNNTKLLKKEEKILSYVKPCNYGYYTDCYFVNTYYKGKDDNMYSAKDKVKQWVESNGGTFKQLSEKMIIGENKGFIVQIVFPTYGHAGRDMKNIMANLIQPERKK